MILETYNGSVGFTFTPVVTLPVDSCIDMISLLC
jgi:hypothetical protein